MIGERRDDGVHKYYFSNLPSDTPLDELIDTVKERWPCEMAHKDCKQELGLDHFEGRKWCGHLRHALLVMMAYNFQQELCLKYPEIEAAAAGTEVETEATVHDERAMEDGVDDAVEGEDGALYRAEKKFPHFNG